MFIATISILLFLLAHLFVWLHPKRSRWIVLWYFFSIGSYIGYLLFFVSDYFTGAGITTGVLYHLFHGQILESSGMLQAYVPLIRTGIIVTILYLLLLCVTVRGTRRSLTIPNNTAYIFACTLISLLCHPLLFNFFTYAQASTPLAIATEDIIAILPTSTIDAADPYQFTTYYAENNVTAHPDKPQKNLLLVYLESVEETFSVAATFSNLTPNLDRLSKEFVSFSNIHQVPTAAYTIGGVVASQCGLPLFSSTRNELHEHMKSSFLSGATCLGDILNQAGYTNEYIGGAASNFAGKKIFLASHGYDTILGREELVARKGLNPQTDLHNWGVYDDVLFDVYTERFDALSASSTPFMLTTLTLDTHPPTGYVSPRCRDAGIDRFANTMLNAVACTDYLVGELVDHVRNSPYADNTTIVIVSDHLAMRSDVTPLLNKHRRTNRITIIDSDATPARFDGYGTTIDTGTTILSYIGFEGRIGLGYDLTDSTLVPLRQAVTALHTNWFFDVIDLWELPRFTDSITIHPDAEELTLGAQTYAIPAFINFTNTWESAITFRDAHTPDILLTYPSQMEPYKSYLLVEECRMLAPDLLDAPLYCIGYGSSNEVYTVEPLDVVTTISKDVFMKKARVAPHEY